MMIILKHLYFIHHFVLMGTTKMPLGIVVYPIPFSHSEHLGCHTRKLLTLSISFSCQVRNNDKIQKWQVFSILPNSLPDTPFPIFSLKTPQEFYKSSWSKQENSVNKIGSLKIKRLSDTIFQEEDAFGLGQSGAEGLWCFVISILL